MKTKEELKENTRGEWIKQFPIIIDNKESIMEIRGRMENFFDVIIDKAFEMGQNNCPVHQPSVEALKRLIEKQEKQIQKSTAKGIREELEKYLPEVEVFTINELLPSLAQGGALPADKRKAIVKKVAGYERWVQGTAGIMVVDVSRTGEKSPAVGSMFDFVEKNAPKDLKGKWIRVFKDSKGVETKADSFTVADYEKEIVWRDG